MTGKILQTCPVDGCVIWTPHSHGETLVAPVPHPQSDPTLLDAYRKQLAHMDPGLVYLAWQGQEGITPEDLLDEFKRAEGLV